MLNLKKITIVYSLLHDFPISNFQILSGMIFLNFPNILIIYFCWKWHWSKIIILSEMNSGQCSGLSDMVGFHLQKSNSFQVKILAIWRRKCWLHRRRFQVNLPWFLKFWNFGGESFNLALLNSPGPWTASDTPAPVSRKSGIQRKRKKCP